MSAARTDARSKRTRLAMTVLRSRLLETKRKVAEENAKYAAERKSQVGSGERSEKSRLTTFRKTGSRITGLT